MSPAGDAARLGYGVPDDVTDTIDRAETLVFAVAERRHSDTLKPVNVLLRPSGRPLPTTTGPDPTDVDAHRFWRRLHC